MLGLKNLAMLPIYFDYIFVHLKQKARLRPDLSPKFLSTSGPKPARTRPRKARPDLQLWIVRKNLLLWRSFVFWMSHFTV